MSVEARDIVKLRGRPKAFATKRRWKHRRGRVNSPGYGNTAKDVTMDNPQPSPKGGAATRRSPMGAVHRLNGSGWGFAPCLRYSRSCRESGLTEEGAGSLNVKALLQEPLGRAVRFGAPGLNASSWFLPKFPSG